MSLPRDHALVAWNQQQREKYELAHAEAQYEREHGRLTAAAAAADSTGQLQRQRENAFRVLDALVRVTVAAFYEPRVLVMLAPIVKNHREVDDKNLAEVLHLPERMVRECLRRLYEDGLLMQRQRKIRKRRVTVASAQQQQPEVEEYEDSEDEDAQQGIQAPKGVHTQRESDRDKQIKKMRASAAMRTFWHIDYRLFLDVLRLKLHKMTEALSSDAHRAEEAMGASSSSSSSSANAYVCPRCRKTFGEFDVNELDTDAFGKTLCDRCGGEVHESDLRQKADESLLRKERFNLMLNLRFSPLLAEAQKLVDDNMIPEVDKRKRDVLEDEEGNQVGMQLAAQSGKGGAAGTGVMLGSHSARYGWDDESAPAPGANVTVSLADGEEDGALPGEPSRKKNRIAWLESAGDRQRELERNAQLAQQNEARARLAATGVSSASGAFHHHHQQQQGASGIVSAATQIDGRAVTAAVKREEDLTSTVAGGDSNPGGTAGGADVHFVLVAGEQVPFLDISEEHQSKMTDAEYEAYSAKYAEMYGDDAGDDLSDGDDRSMDSLDGL